MASLRDLRTGTVIPLRASHRLGRDPSSDTVFTDREVSADHARLRWRDGHWVIRDLGSNNGTVVQGRPLRGVQRTLRRGMRIELGDPAIALELVDDGPPEPFARCEDGRIAQGRGRELYLPSIEDCDLVILPGERGGWSATWGEEIQPVSDRSIIELRGLSWELSLSRPLAGTMLSTAARYTLAQTRLRFVVSYDEESVQLFAEVAGEAVDLGAHAHHYALLTLARKREADREAGLPEAHCGWWERRQLAAALRMDSAHLNVHLFRCRDSLRGKSWRDADGLIETLRRSKIRIGVRDLAIERAPVR